MDLDGILAFFITWFVASALALTFVCLVIVKLAHGG